MLFTAMSRRLGLVVVLVPVTMLLAILLGAIIAGVSYLGFILILLGTLLTVMLLLRPELALVLFIVVSPLHYFIRSVEFTNELLAAWRDIFLAILVFAWFVRLATREYKIVWGSVVAVHVVFAIWGVVQIINTGDYAQWLLGYRNLVKYALLVAIVPSFLEHNPKLAKRLLNAMVVGAVLLSILQLMLYFQVLDLPAWASWATGRGLGDWQAERMPSLIGNGVAGLAIYLACGLVIILARWITAERISWMPFVAALVVGAAVLFTFSYNGWLALGAGLLAAAWMRGYRPNLQSLVTAVLAVAAILGLWFLAGDPVSYAGTILGFWEYWLPLTWQSPIVGLGFGLFGSGAGTAFVQGLMIQRTIQVTVDGGWIEVAAQIGWPVTLLVLFAQVYVVLRGARFARSLIADSRSVILIPATSALLALLLSIHQVAWVRLGSDVNYFVLIGIIVSLLQSQALQQRVFCDSKKLS